MPTGERFGDQIRDLLLFYVATSSKNNSTRDLRTSLSGYVACHNTYLSRVAREVFFRFVCGQKKTSGTNWRSLLAGILLSVF